jgi:hypothetical protein
MKTKETWGFCETPKEKCTMNYCDENGCQNRERNYVKDSSYSEKQVDDAYNKGFKDAMLKYRE